MQELIETIQSFIQETFSQPHLTPCSISQFTQSPAFVQNATTMSVAQLCTEVECEPTC